MKMRYRVPRNNRFKSINLEQDQPSRNGCHFEGQFSHCWSLMLPILNIQYNQQTQKGFQKILEKAIPERVLSPHSVFMNLFCKLQLFGTYIKQIKLKAVLYIKQGSLDNTLWRMYLYKMGLDSQTIAMQLLNSENRMPQNPKSSA